MKVFVSAAAVPPVKLGDLEPGVLYRITQKHRLSGEYVCRHPERQEAIILTGAEAMTFITNPEWTFEIAARGTTITIVQD